MCWISRCWLDSMIIAQVWLRLATIKGHSLKCAVLLYWGGPGGYKSQSVTQYLVWPSFASCSATLLLHIELMLIVACVMLVHSSSMAVAGYWQELECAVVYADPEHPKHAQRVTCPVVMRGWRLYPRALRMIHGSGELGNKKVFSDYLQVGRGWIR